MSQSKETTIHLLGVSEAHLREWMVSRNFQAFRAIQVLQWVHQKGETDPQRMHTLPLPLREALSKETTVEPFSLFSESIAKDGTCKWLFSLKGGGAIETVYIPEKTHATLCISSQVGCIINCRFCYTAQQGFQRNLSTDEVVGQLWWVLHRRSKIQALLPIKNVVFMGMGEPLLNEEAVFTAIRLFTHDKVYGLSKRRVTLSTSGVAPALERFVQEIDAALALSLHAPNDTLRNELVPLNKKYPIACLLDLCKKYIAKSPKRRHVFIEYVLLQGINDSLNHALELARLLSHIRVKINLIPFNPFPGARYQSSSPGSVEAFAQYLREKGFLTFVRRTRGENILAACGQLAGQVQDKTSRQKRAETKSPLPFVSNDIILQSSFPSG